MALITLTVLLLLPAVILLTYPYFKTWFYPRAIPGIPHFPITSILGDLPVLARDTEKYGFIFERGGVGRRAIDELGPVFQVSLSSSWRRCGLTAALI